MWTARLESGAVDRAAIREITLAAFPTPLEADLVDALRADPEAWLPYGSWLAVDSDGVPAGHALLSRAWVGDAPALALGPCSVLPDRQRQGAGSAAIEAALAAARDAGEHLVVLLGHADYYPRFGLRRASGFGIRASFEVGDEYLMALPLDSGPVAHGTIRWAPAFGV